MNIHASVFKDVAEFVLEDLHYGNPFLFLGVTLSEKASDFEIEKNEEIALKSSLPS